MSSVLLGLSPEKLAPFPGARGRRVLTITAWLVGGTAADRPGLAAVAAASSTRVEPTRGSLCALPDGRRGRLLRPRVRRRRGCAAAGRRACPADVARVPGDGRVPRAARSRDGRACCSRRATRASRSRFRSAAASPPFSRRRRRSSISGREYAPRRSATARLLRRGVLRDGGVVLWTITDLPPLDAAEQ